MKRYTGKNLDDILAQAAQEKNCDVADLTAVDVEEKPGGLLGLGAQTSADIFSKEDVKEFLFDYLGSFFMGIDQDLEVAIEEKDNAYVVRMNAENNAVLIGKMGKTLSAFNTVVRGAVNSEFHKHIDVLVDVNHYKEDRYEKLASMARRIGRQVRSPHVDAELDPMPNDERKVIHQTLNGWDHITTQSIGEGPSRHVCIRYTEETPAAEAEETEEPAEDTGTENSPAAESSEPETENPEA